jgi:hypothetical protein
MTKINYEELGKKIGSLIQEKQESYGDSFHKSGEVMKQLFPKGIPPESYVDALALVRIIDKLFRLATDPNYNGENSWGDIAGYALLRLGDVENRKAASKSDSSVRYSIKSYNSGSGGVSWPEFIIQDNNFKMKE